MAAERQSLRVAQLRRNIVDALTDLYRRDLYLLQRDANERSITHKLAEHLQRRFPNWDVDCEYNRRGSDPKRLPLPQSSLNRSHVRADSTEAVTVFPDIIIHHRGTDHNVAVIEVKKVGGHDDTRDAQKIDAFSSSPLYRYEFGLLLKLDASFSSCSLYRYLGIEWWEDWSGELERAIDGARE